MIVAYLGPGDLFNLLSTRRILYLIIAPVLTKLAVEDKDGLPALHWAVTRDYPGLVQLLLKNKANINAYCSVLEERTPLHIAASRRNVPIVQILLGNGANVNLQGFERPSALQLALGIDAPEIRDFYSDVIVLRRHKIWLENEQGLEKTVELLLQQGSDPNYQDSYSTSPLHIAVMTASEKITRLLLNNGADVNIVGRGGLRPLHTVAMSTHRDEAAVAKVLLENGADIEALNIYRETALHCAMTVGNWDIAETLLLNGADDEAEDIAGETALECAFVENRNESETSRRVMKLLEDRRAMMDEYPVNYRRKD